MHSVRLRAMPWFLFSIPTPLCAADFVIMSVAGKPARMRGCSHRDGWHQQILCDPLLHGHSDPERRFCAENHRSSALRAATERMCASSGHTQAAGPCCHHDDALSQRGEQCSDGEFQVCCHLSSCYVHTQRGKTTACHSCMCKMCARLKQHVCTRLFCHGSTKRQRNLWFVYFCSECLRARCRKILQEHLNLCAICRVHAQIMAQVRDVAVEASSLAHSG